jgi:hypothetical protein
MKYLKRFEDDMYQNNFKKGDIIVLTRTTLTQINLGFILNGIYRIVRSSYGKKFPYSIEQLDNDDPGATIAVNDSEIRMATPEEIAAKKYNL